MQIFQSLQVWQMAHACVLTTYQVTRTFPEFEKFGLTSQIRRAAVSVMANLAEGCGRGSNKDFGRFLQYAIGSCCEWESLLILAGDLEYLTAEQAGELCRQIIEIRVQLIKLQERVKPKQRQPLLPIKF